MTVERCNHRSMCRVKLQQKKEINYETQNTASTLKAETPRPPQHNSPRSCPQKLPALYLPFSPLPTPVRSGLTFVLLKGSQLRSLRSPWEVLSPHPPGHLTLWTPLPWLAFLGTTLLWSPTTMLAAPWASPILLTSQHWGCPGVGKLQPVGQIQSTIQFL